MRLDYTRAARQDLSEIWDWNEGRYGARHAADYADFLVATIASLKSDPQQGRPVPLRPSLRQFTIRMRTSGYGHIAFYRVEGESVQIVRVLHSARNWPELLED